MSRARIEALALVNWKGVFYERYRLDRAVTALEGANGAGKTTVMIAAYIAMFPEIAKLRFTNLGEHEATRGDRGIYGRLGREGWPSLTVLDLRYGKGLRVLAGVKIERRNDPVVELEPFLIQDLAEDVRLQDVLLDVRREGERAIDRLPDRHLLMQRVARAGGKLRWLEPRAYFRELFDLGLTPLRLDAEEERTRFNAMLRTSMIGGISGTLSGGLREFVLREDTHLIESLRAMRENLSACQATRQQVEWASAAQAEIAAVHGAAERMFTRAVHAARLRAEEQAQAVLTARGAEEIAAEKTRSTAEARVLAEAAVVRADDEERAAVEREQQARDWKTKLERAFQLAGERRDAEGRRDGLRSQADLARAAEERATDTLDLARHARDAANRERDRLSRALADSRHAWEELSRRAGLHLEARRRQTELAGLLGATVSAPLDGPAPPSFAAPSSFAQHRDDRRARVAALDAELAEARRRVAGAEAARRAFNEVVSALERVLTELGRVGEITRGPVPPAEAWDRALSADKLLRDLQALAQEGDTLGRQLREATQRAERQRALRAGLAALGCAPASRTELMAIVDKAREDRDRLQNVRAERQQRHSSTQAELRHAHARLTALDEELPRWQAVQALARDVSARVGALPTDAAGLVTLEDRLRAEEQRAHALADAATQRARVARSDADRLASGEGGLAPELVDACDLLDGELVARRYDDLPLEDAAVTEALLGPLRRGVLVRDPVAAANRLLAEGTSPEEIWLVGALPEALPGDRRSSGVIVREGSAVRVSRIPERPVLGGAARRRRVADLQAQAEQEEGEAQGHQREASRLGEAVARVRELARASVRWLAPDPAAALEAARGEVHELGSALTEATDALVATTKAQNTANDLETRLARLLPDALLLDAPDAEAEKESLAARHARSLRVAPALARCQDAAKTLRERLLVLQSVPPSVREVAELQAQLHTSEAARDREDTLVRALEWLVENGEALTWTDAPARLRDAQAGEASLRGDHARAVELVEQAEAAAQRAEREADRARSALGDANNRLVRAEEEVGRLLQAITGVGVGEPGPGELLTASEGAIAAGEALMAARRTRDQAKEARTRSEIAAELAEKDHEAAREALGRAEMQARPALEAWSRLGREVEVRRFAAVVFAEAVMTAVRTVTSSIQLSQEARQAQVELRAHLGHAKGAAAVLNTLEAPADELRWEHYVRGWEAVRAWVRERVPVNVSESDDPVTALADLGRHLVGLRATLVRHEDQLKASSASVADHIGHSLKRARTLIQRLNADLDVVHFGSIQRVEVQAVTRPEMNRLLDALRGEQAQVALFSTGVSLEEALAAIYHRETGGRIAGQKLLDYREYLDLKVRVRREGSVEWEPASATRMSTGEAIGVGAALMMVVLTAWERRETLGRAARKHGSLRFLFLDEANRLSQDNLKTLFELCDNLELQLLVAAPEVAQSEGNITYRLVRRLVAGEPVVDVTGRRTET